MCYYYLICFPSMQCHVCDSYSGNTYHIRGNINNVFYMALWRFWVQTIKLKFSN